MDTTDITAPSQTFPPSGERLRILVVTDDVLTRAMAGPAIRAWNLAELLSEEHHVTLVTTSAHCERRSDHFAVEAGSHERFEALERWAHVIVTQGYSLSRVPALKATDKIVVVDLYDPFHLEALELSKDQRRWTRDDTIGRAVRVVNEQVSRGDFFMCASEDQRQFWLGHLAAFGRLNSLTVGHDSSLRQLIDVVPFGLSPDPPRRVAPAIKGVVPGIGANDRVVLWGGGIYNWFDPITLIRAAALLEERSPEVKFFFLGVRHPDPASKQMSVSRQTRALAERLGLLGRQIFFNEGWVDYERRSDYLLDSDVGISLHLDHVETEFSFRTRILDYIWAGLPIVATAGDTFARLISDSGIGLVVPPEDPAAVADALGRLLSDGSLSQECQRAARELRSKFAWPEVAKPLLSFCRKPRPAVDRQLHGELEHAFPRPAHLPPWWLRDADTVINRLKEGGTRAVLTGAISRSRRLFNSGTVQS